MTMISASEAQKKLTVIWTVLLLPTFLFIIYQTLAVLVGENDASGELWAWFFQLILPTYSMIVAVITADAMAADPVQKNVKIFVYKFTRGVSVLYLLILMGVTFAGALHSTPAINVFVLESVVFMIPLQGIVAASLGVFFVQQE